MGIAWSPRSCFIIVCPFLALAGCGYDTGPAFDESTDSGGNAASHGSAMVTVGGGPVAFPGTATLRANCDLSMGHFALSMYPQTATGSGIGLFALAAAKTREHLRRASLDDQAPLATGRLEGQYEINEAQGDGRILTYRGDAEVEIRSIDRSRKDTADIDFSASGVGDDGVEWTAEGRCLAFEYRG